jgi:outer membrane protein OmpA-like peptidoglycan-associated protein
MVMAAYPNKRPLALAAIGLLVLLSGCGTPADRIILMPGEGARPTGGVTVKSAKGELLLDKPLAQATVGRDGAIEAGQATKEQVQERYGEMLNQRPPSAKTWTVYFQAGSNVLVPESASVLDEVRRALSGYAGGELVLTGHSDRVGSVPDNDRLSLQRASALRDQLVTAGFDAARITVAGRGEREPLVPTADEVAEPRNRRVEIKLR